MVSPVTTSGLGSGIDVQSVVTQLIAAERAPSDQQFATATAAATTKMSALGNLKSALSNFQSTLASFNSVTSFGQNAVSSSDSSSISATATADAVPNTYTMEVSKLATTHSLASTSFADTTSAIGTGTMTFRFGTTDYNTTTNTYNGFTLNPDSKVTTLTIDSSNNSLTGIMKSINSGNFGVTASIVRASDGYKLLLASNKTGAKNSLEVSVNDGDNNNTDTGASAGLSNFAFNSDASNLQQTSAASDANYKINGLAITSSDNVVQGAVAGVDLTLSKVTTSPVTLTVSKDNSQALSAMQSFVSGYNTLAKTLSSLTSYDPTNNVAGPLLGDFTVRSITSQASNILHSAVAGLTGDATTLSSIGLATNTDGTYTLDTNKFTTVLNTEPEKLPALFSAFGTPSNSNISYKASTDNTVVGNYAVNITSLATAGSYSGNSVLPDFTPGNYLTLDANNSTFTVSVDGVSSGNLSLTQGQYQSGAALAQEIQARINGATPLVNAGVGVTVSYDSSSQSFRILSNSAGATSTVAVTAVGSNVTSALGFSVQNGTAGTDVAGSIGGVAGTGLGNVLTAADSSDAKGLEVTVSGTNTGSLGTINFTRGITNQLGLMFTNILATTGGLQNRIDDYNNQLKSITDQSAQKELLWTAEKDRLMTQFTAMDTLVSQLNSTSTFLTTQLASLPGVVSK